MRKGKLLMMLERHINEYRLDANNSLRRNSHMNESVMESKEDVPQQVIDALLVDFVNYVGAQQGLDYGLYTKYLRKKIKSL